MSVREEESVWNKAFEALGGDAVKCARGRARPLRVGRALSGAERCESQEERLWSRDWGCLVWPRGCAHVAKRVCTRGQEGVYTWLAGLVRRVYSGPSQPVVRTFSVMIIS